MHLADIHLEKGMQCTDCHFAQDNHGNGKIYGEPRAAVEIDCIDCHGTIRQKATLVTSGPAAPETFCIVNGVRTPNAAATSTLSARPGDCAASNGAATRSSSAPCPTNIKNGKSCRPPTPSLPATCTSAKNRYAPSSSTKMESSIPHMPQDDTHLAHGNSSMTCYACHTSWTPTCFGCHLQMTANARKPMLHNEGLLTRNYTSYNFQVLRDDIYMLGVDGTVTGHRIAPARSSCAVLVSSQNANREWLYYTQQTVSAEGFSGQAYSTFVPHTVRGRETKQCSDCHVSAANDNNAWMAQLLLQGTNFMNFMGRYVYVATGKGGLEAIAVAEHDEPEAIYGSDLQRIAYPENFKKFVGRHRELAAVAEHPGNILDIQARGEYAYAANGPGGLRVYDIANIDNKGFSERVVTSPVSPIGQRFYVATKNAAGRRISIDAGHRSLCASASPKTKSNPFTCSTVFSTSPTRKKDWSSSAIPISKPKSPGRRHASRRQSGQQFSHIAPLAFNPGGVLTGARRITIAGTFAYILTDKSLVVVDLNNPLAPRVTATIGAPGTQRRRRNRRPIPLRLRRSITTA